MDYAIYINKSHVLTEGACSSTKSTPLLQNSAGCNFALNSPLIVCACSALPVVPLHISMHLQHSLQAASIKLNPPEDRRRVFSLVKSSKKNITQSVLLFFVQLVSTFSKWLTGLFISFDSCSWCHIRVLLALIVFIK